MPQYNYGKMLGTLKEKGMRQEDLAKKIGVNPATINRKLNGYGYFTQKEMTLICEILEVPYEEIPLYFFTH